MEKLLDPKELAAKLNVPLSWIYAETRKKTIPMLKIGKYCRFREADVLEWLEKRNERLGMGNSVNGK